MAGRIRNEDVALVRERAAIADVVGEHVTLRNAGGGSLKGLCPFHDEKSPSFHVTPAKGLWYCFGCGEGGDVIAFLRKIDHLEFNEAVEKLAARAGVELRYEEGGAAPRRQKGERTRLAEANRAAAAYYVDQLGSPEAETGRRFLTERGFDAEAARHFGVGYALQGWDGLTRSLRAAGFTDRELVTAGLAKEGQRGLIDRFRGRLLWPIRDIGGDVIGFGARKLYEDDPGPKYLNTPETPLYKKSQVLYGIDLARREIAHRKQAVVVEGYTDVMACHLSGIETAVATCGTAFGEDHIRVLRRLLMDADTFDGEVVFTFDGDAAGQKAAMRAFDDDQKFVAQTFVAVEPHGLDPCELRQAQGPEAVRQLVGSRVPLFEFAIRSVLSRHDLDTAEGRVAALRAAAPVVARIRDLSLRPEYARLLAGWLGMEMPAVVDAVRQAGRTTSRQPGPSAPAEPDAEPSPTAGRPAVTRPDPRDRRLVVERELLKLALQHPALVAPGFDGLGPEAFRHPAYVAVGTAIAGAGGVSPVDPGSGQHAWVDQVLEAAPDDRVRQMVTELAVEPPFCDGEPDARYAVEQLARVQERLVVARIEELRSRLQRVDPLDAEAGSVLFAELVTLEQRRRELRDSAFGPA
jgi:DNA primase